MNHKRGKPKSGRAGCLMCKPHKHQGTSRARRYPKEEAEAESHLSDPRTSDPCDQGTCWACLAALEDEPTQEEIDALTQNVTS